jgi:hypothetical protein
MPVLLHTVKLLEQGTLGFVSDRSKTKLRAKAIATARNWPYKSIS